LQLTQRLDHSCSNEIRGDCDKTTLTRLGLLLAQKEQIQISCTCFM
jgi:hypothetical protein